MDFSDEDSGTLNLALPEIDLTKDLANPRNRLLVFDDLERCRMPVPEVLGYINGFVEHDKLKAIIVANEDEIRSNPESRYDEIKEKLIGQTLTVSAPAGEAFDEFANSISHPVVRDFLQRYREVVLTLHAQGGRSNLRTLKHAMWDFEKIGSQLEPRHWIKEDSIFKIMKGVMAVTLEHRAGFLKEEDLTRLIGNRLGRLMLGQVKKEKTIADEVDARYPQIDFDDVLIDAANLAAILLRGEMDRPALIEALDRTNDYAEPDAQPLWLQAVNSFASDDATCARIADNVEAGFVSRAFTVRGELLHIMGIRLWFAEIGLIAKTPEKVVWEAKAYIDDLADSGRLETDLDTPNEILRDISYGGYRSISAEKAEYRAITAYYDEAVDRVVGDRYPQIAKELLATLSSDPDDFLFDLAVNNVRHGRYWERPVLASLSAKEYAEVAFNARPDIQSRAIETLHLRHESMSVLSLRPELAWISNVRSELEGLMSAAKPMNRCRLKSLISRNLDPLLEKNGTVR